MKKSVTIYPLKNKFCYVVGEMEYANYYGSLLPHSVKVFMTIREAKKYQLRDLERLVIIRRKIRL